MKKTIIVTTLIAMLLIAFALSVYAEGIETTAPQWFKDMITWKKEQIKQAVSAGQLTDQQAKLYYDRIDQMERFHLENGFTNMMGSGAGFGGCHSGINNGTQNSKVNYGLGMMRGRL